MRDTSPEQLIHSASAIAHLMRCYVTGDNAQDDNVLAVVDGAAEGIKALLDVAYRDLVDPPEEIE